MIAKKTMRSFGLLTVATLILVPTRTWAERIEVDFTGLVFFAGGTPYGATIPAPSPMSGSFQYDTTSLQTHTFPSAAGYEQHIVNGLTVNFSGATVQANDYVVEIGNNVSQPGGSTADVVTVEFNSSLTPALSQPMIVNGVAQSVGLMNLNFFGLNTLWSDTSLPSLAQFGPFNNMQGIFSHVPVGAVDVLFSITSQQAKIVPEPSTFVLALCPAILWAFARWKSLKRRN